ncbi:hypothetical protein [Shewanella algae]|uniref:DUF304 domain-containing protein n=2 Tax=Bacteria TaxID=2 RepID=A0AAU6V1L7_UNCXX|nr:hypothetical protein [Shewanella algae]MBO2631707.1 hypothetical protein [Shewanella algae]QNV04416.1 hypothetical protein EIY89_04280 [Shewanella algae]
MMSQLVKRPNYIQYSQDGLERGWFTQADITKLEDEPAIFQWTMPRAFFYRFSGLVTILIIWGVMAGIPMLFFSWIALTTENPEQGHWDVVIFVGIFFSSMLLLFYYLTRFQYHHVAYKITESGFLRDEVKLCPRWGYRAINPEGLMWVLRVMTLILVPIALVIHPFLLVGVGGLALLSFKKVEPSEPEKAHYIPNLWHKSGVASEKKLSIVNLNPRRRIIDITSADLTKGGAIFCTPKNYEEVKAFVLKKLPEAKVVKEELSI